MTRCVGRNENHFDVVIFDHLSNRGVFRPTHGFSANPTNEPIGEEVGWGTVSIRE
jgi:hypothetical protein